MIALRVANVSRRFGGRPVLRNVTVDACSGDVLGILGENGSGKSTLLRIVAGVLRPDTGTVALTVDGMDVSESERPLRCGFVAPYLHLYDEFSPREVLHLHARLRGATLTSTSAERSLTHVGLQSRADDPIRTFSSGMRQRVAFAVATVAEPSVLLLDEPSTTLDAVGREILSHLVAEHRERGGLVIIATNDEREHHLCTRFLSVSSSSAAPSAL